LKKETGGDGDEERAKEAYLDAGAEGGNRSYEYDPAPGDKRLACSPGLGLYCADFHVLHAGSRDNADEKRIPKNLWHKFFGINTQHDGSTEISRAIVLEEKAQNRYCYLLRSTLLAASSGVPLGLHPGRCSILHTFQGPFECVPHCDAR
jgi:hypothetical protein